MTQNRADRRSRKPRWVDPERPELPDGPEPTKPESDAVGFGPLGGFALGGGPPGADGSTGDDDASDEEEGGHVAATLGAVQANFGGDGRASAATDASDDDDGSFKGNTKIHLTPQSRMEGPGASIVGDVTMDLGVNGEMKYEPAPPPRSTTINAVTAEATAQALPADVPTSASIALSSVQFAVPFVSPADAPFEDDEVLSATTVVITRGDPRELLRQVEDVRRRLNKIEGQPNLDPALRGAAMNAGWALTHVLEVLDGRAVPEYTRPVIRALLVLAADVTEVMLPLLNPPAAALFIAARRIAAALLGMDAFRHLGEKE